MLSFKTLSYIKKTNDKPSQLTIPDDKKTLTFKHLLKLIGQGIWYSRNHLIHSYLLIPIGIIIIMTILYGFNILLKDILKLNFLVQY